MNWTRSVRSTAAVLLLALLTSNCSLRDDPSGPGVVAGGLQVAPVLPSNFGRFAGGLGIDRIHLVIQGQAGNVLYDEVIPFSPFDNSMTLQLPVRLTSATEQLQVQIDYEDQLGTVLYTGQQSIQARVGQTVQPPQIPVSYVGPGQNVYYVTVTPSDSLVTVGDTIQMDLVAYDTSFQVVPNVYVSWQTDDPGVPIDAYGRLPGSPNRSVAVIYAETPNGSATSARMYFAPGTMAIAPDSLETLPGATLSFYTYGGGGFGNYTYTVNGIAGGDSTVGTIDPLYGFFTAPSVPPNPARVRVCATTGTDSSCASVLVGSPPTPGGDVVMVGDTYFFSDAALAALPGNQTMLTRMIGFTGAGSRGGNGARTVLFDRGRAAPCLVSGVCADSAITTLSTALTNAGYTIQRHDTAFSYRSIAPGVKTIVVWNPNVYLTDREANELKRFARGGGRIVLVSDDTTSLGGSLSNVLNVVNDFSYRLGASMGPSYPDLFCGTPATLTGSDIRAHQITTGVGSVQLLCSSEIFLGNNSYPLLMTGQLQVVAAVGKIDPTPSINYGD